MKAFLLLAILSTVICVSVSASAATLYVDGSVSSSGDGTSWGTAFRKIQEGIDKALEGDTVTVAKGVYVENIHFDGTNIILTSTDPLKPDVVAGTIIDGNQAGSVVAFYGTEDESCVLCGFTIRNGEAENGGGIFGQGTRATVRNDVIAGNSAGRDGGGLYKCAGTVRDNTIYQNSAGGGGGGLYQCAGTIQKNVITGNSASNLGGGLNDCSGTIRDNQVSDNSASCGGGLVFCEGRIENNLIAHNSAVYTGGGVQDCRATIRNNTIRDNSAVGGGGISSCSGTIENNLIAFNIAQNGGGLIWCYGTVQNNTICGNSADQGAALDSCNASIRNCIIWGNTGSQIYASSPPSFSCIQDWTEGGEGNISSDPGFVAPAERDLHLQNGSPCIDAGVSFFWFVWPQRDLDGNCRLVGNRVDMGCYEFGASVDADGDFLSDSDEAAYGADRLNEDTDGDGLRDGLEILRGSDPAVSTPPGLFHVPSEVPTIQGALFLAVNGDQIVVAPGTYRENVRLLGRDAILRSSDPDDPDTVASTIIDGAASGPVVSFTGNESEACSLSGFTIQNSSGLYRGGICGGTDSSHTHAAIENNVITGNSAFSGGGLIFCDGIIQNNRITGNTAGQGGGLYDCDGTIRENIVTDNLATYGGGLALHEGGTKGSSFSRERPSQSGAGGGLAFCDGLIFNNRIAANKAEGTGGGLAYCHGTIEGNSITGNSGEGLGYCGGTIQKNVISDNSADYSYGGGLNNCSGTIQNNLITGNWAGYHGGGLAFCNGMIRNNTVARNRGMGDGCGLYDCDGPVLSCIVWANRGGSQLWDCSVPAYSCIQNWTGGGEANISYNPHFVDPDNGDFHLRSWSPGIDAGDPSSDFSQEPQPNGGRVNMGAYGNTPEAACKSPDTDSDGLPDDWEFKWFGSLQYGAAADPDGDAIPNSREYSHAWDPVVAALVENLTKGVRYQSVQVALWESEEGDEIVVRPGVCTENISFGGKNVVLRSTVPWDPDVVAKTIIEGNPAEGRVSVVTFSGTEGETCVLAGFTIRNGRAQTGGGICGGTEDGPTRAVIRDNVITRNSASNGGGLAFCNGTIHNNVVADNEALSREEVHDETGCGGGLFCCNGAIQDNIIRGNSAVAGGGLHSCDGTIWNNAIIGNFAYSGGGLYDCHGTIRNNIISANSASDWGGGVAWSKGVIQNNTIIGNSANFEGSALAWCYGSIKDCIIWGNRGGSQLWDCVVPTYCCIEKWVGGGQGNIPFDPYFVDAEDGDFHVRSWSPCIDAGDPSSGFSQEPEPNGGRVNMGAYGNTPEAACKSPDAESDGLPDDWELYWFASLKWDSGSDTDGDDIPNMAEYRYGWNPKMAAATRVANQTKGLWYQTIQAALWESEDRNEIVVYPGVYREYIGFGGKNVVLRSTAPSNAAVVAATIIDANQASSVVTFAGAERETCVLSGFTVRNGKASHGCGINGYQTRATIQNNVICGNVASFGGGGLYYCNGTIQNNAISANSAAYGAGLAFCGGTIENNLIAGNSAADMGGGLAYCRGGIIQNNTISHNSANGEGGGLYACDGAIQNCIIWGNAAPDGPELFQSSVPTYCCIQGWTEGGTGNIAEDPQFAGPANGNFRLLPSSPCIDAGYNDPGLPATDIAGMHRMMFGGKSLTVDMGAYEFYINDLTRGPNVDQTTFTWSSLADKTYSIFYSADLLSWHLAIESFPSSGNTTTSWLDDGSLTGVPPLLLPRRFYRTVENP